MGGCGMPYLAIQIECHHQMNNTSCDYSACSCWLFGPRRLGRVVGYLTGGFVTSQISYWMGNALFSYSQVNTRSEMGIYLVELLRVILLAACLTWTK